MMRAAVARRPRVVIPNLGAGAQQRRQKVFMRRRNDYGEFFYTVNKWGGERPKPPPDHELFQANDLLLDLEDVDSRHVRKSTEDDEAQMLKKWSVDTKRQELGDRLEQVEIEVDWSRRKAFEVSSGPAKPWLPSRHDILSAALRGPPLAAPPIDSSQGQHGFAKTRTPGLCQEPGSLHAVCSENGIPERSKGNDTQLLHWLQLRDQFAQSDQHATKHPPSPVQVAAALKKQDSITGIRRLVSQGLSEGLDATSFQQTLRHDQTRPVPNLSSETRGACVNILGQHQKKDASCRDLLSFLGNLGQRLSLSGVHVGTPLCGLALRLSAEICKPDATLEYLDTGFSYEYWTASDQVMNDVLCSLRSYLHHLGIRPQSRFIDVYDRRVLVELLTGVGDNPDTVHESIRSLALHFLQDPPNENTALLALDIYRSYIVLLGQLGAVASLWQEWRLSAIELENKVRNGKLLVSDGQPGTQVVEAFQSAIKASISVVALTDDVVPTDLDLAGCATLDLKSIEMQNHDAWLGDQQKEARLMREFADGDTRAALGLPLDGWLEVVRRLAQGTGPQG
ncbi:hypothetical protein FZEAL_7100 [Fusarium zealandicum]|uniref:Uncharacterized protein n=1 Tax=Fusarium zealandicum TaxID=1053134 RepID=A0A8H4UGM2_9HYPO|nr:hypothetical protein FZEAL_7100 [Fusarium zealandicum]